MNVARESPEVAKFPRGFETLLRTSLSSAIRVSCFLLIGIAASSVGQAPTWVANLTKDRASWDRATIAWVAFGGIRIIGSDNSPETVVLESRKQGEAEWSVLGTFLYTAGDHTNQSPWPDPPEILLPERILASPPTDTSTGGTGGTVVIMPNWWAAEYTHHRLEPATVYEYRMKAANIHGDGPYSPVLTLTTDPLPPPWAPINGFVRNLAGGKLEVLWTRSNLASEFIVERKNSSEDWQQVAVMAGTEHSWIDQTVSPGLSYGYRVSARNISGTSSPSPEFSAVAHRIGLVAHDRVDGGISTLWAERSGVAVAAGPDEPEKMVLLFGGSGSRYVTTRPLVFLLGGFLEFDFWSDETSNASHPILLQASLKGQQWTTLGEVNPEENRGSWRTISIQLPAAWSSLGMRFRFVQNFQGLEASETWAIRDIRILAMQGEENIPPTISIFTPQRQTIKQSRRSVQIMGLATDDKKLLGWAWSLNDGPWEAADLNKGKRAYWNGIVPKLKKGSNTITVCAYDASGNVSSAWSGVVKVRRRSR